MFLGMFPIKYFLYFKYGILKEIFFYIFLGMFPSKRKEKSHEEKLLSILLTAAMATSVISGTALIVNADSEGDLSGKTFAIVIEIPETHILKKADGFRQVIEAAGGECIIKSLKKQPLMPRFL